MHIPAEGLPFPGHYPHLAMKKGGVVPALILVGCTGTRYERQ